MRHVLSENLRVAQFAAALSRGDVAELGALLLASHHSLAQDYCVSCAELDEAGGATGSPGGAGPALAPERA